MARAELADLDREPAPARPRPPRAPSGRKLVPWIGPGLVWMVSAVGTGSVLFTPRVASEYRYTLLWVLLGVCALMWVMIREAARYSIVTGDSLLEGFDHLPGPRHWAVWVILVPQVVAAVAGIAGLASVAGSAFGTALGGDHRHWGAGLITVAAVLVITDGYRIVERGARVLAGVLVAITVVAAVGVAPPPSDLATGLVPSLPTDPDLYVIVPWIGTILAGSMGIVWFSYWTAARGYGGRSALSEQGEDEDPTEAFDDEERRHRLAGWIRTMSWAAGLGVVAGTVVLVSYLVLGAELLAPDGVLPEGEDVAGDLSRLLSDVWGRTGFWLMILSITVAIGGSVFANQDGWGRSFADMTLIVRDGRSVRGLGRRRLTMVYVATVTGLVPLGVVLAVSDPVAIMSVSGLVAALHTPFIVGLILLVNRRQLPAGLRPGTAVATLMVLSAVLYAGVGALQVFAA